ncbi:uncharacterized protein METZ01_LOCUS187440 [marine metagenome]|uniref:Uncharacterized protein n=1 Tax=marine metagenome TaxID=408172 RepID=A0A382D7V6_9ZZZZ
MAANGPPFFVPGEPAQMRLGCHL